MSDCKNLFKLKNIFYSVLWIQKWRYLEYKVRIYNLKNGFIKFVLGKTVAYTSVGRRCPSGLRDNENVSIRAWNGGSHSMNTRYSALQPIESVFPVFVTADS